MKAANTTIGILAHVDAGKTTLSESILYETGAIRAKGRVDHGDAFLDTDSLEKKRGITIFSKLARFSLQGRPMTLLDTPGHVDFSPEMERTLRVLDLAVLVISATDGVTAQVRLLWKLLRHYEKPAFIFVNKMDQVENGNPEHDANERQRILTGIQRELGTAVVSFGRGQLSAQNEESVAVCDETLMERLLDGTPVTDEEVVRLVKTEKLFPLYWGSALHEQGVKDLLEGIRRYTEPADCPEDFGALVYKVTRDQEHSDARLVWLKITGGTLSVRDTVTEPVHGNTSLPADAADAGEEVEASAEGPETAQEKISGIRFYSGSRYEQATSAGAGEIVAVTGLSFVRAGDGLGREEGIAEELLSPIMTCRVIAEPGTDRFILLRALRGMEEEDPMLHVAVNEETGDVTIQIMGQVQLQVLQELIRKRYGLSVSFGPATIVYKETIRRPVEGVGHFEPLRHYAEVHLLLTPTGPGTGLTFENRCPANTLERNWQRLIMTHLQERVHRGVLTGSDITDMKITLIGGKASKKHTSGGDFRQATYRAVRQGLMMAENILLEPVLAFHMELPQENLGRALNDLSSMQGKAGAPVFDPAGGKMVSLDGTVPAESLGDYAQVLAGYTSGRGRLSVTLRDYEPCHNAGTVIDGTGYDPDQDLRNPSSSVFCSHGAGTVVPWQYVREYMQVDTGWRPSPADPEEQYLTDDFYVFDRTGGEDPLLAGGPEAGDGGTAGAADRNRQGDATGSDRSGKGTGKASGHSIRHGQQDDFAARQRALEAGEKELRAIFEATYGPVRERIHHPENEKYYQAAMDSGAPEDTSGEGGTGGGTNSSGAAAGGSNSRGTDGGKNSNSKARHGRTAEPVQEYLLVDGYNIIYAWSQLRDLAQSDIKAARDRLLDILGNYAGFSRETVIVVFDAYRVPGGTGEVYHLPGLDVVYTKEAETADLYIEKTAHKLSRQHRVTVATSDAVEQVIIYGSGALRLSARGLLEQILAAEDAMRERYLTK